MIIVKVRNFLSSVNEMANYDSEITGLKDIVIWIGMRPKNHGHRIKVSNVHNKMDSWNCFTIMIPSLMIKGDCKLTTKDLESIKTFIKLNEQLIKDYSDLIVSTDFLLKNITKV